MISFSNVPEKSSKVSIDQGRVDLIMWKSLVMLKFSGVRSGACDQIGQDEGLNVWGEGMVNPST